MVFVSMSLWYLLWSHPCVEQRIPVRKVRLGEVLLDAELLMVDIVVRCIVTKQYLEWVKRQCDYKNMKKYDCQPSCVTKLIAA